MKLKSLLGKEKSAIRRLVCIDCEECSTCKAIGYNTARKEDGEVEVELDVKKALIIIEKGTGIYKEALIFADGQGSDNTLKILRLLNDHLAECLVRKK